MAKMYSKSELTFENGYLINKDHDVVALPAKAAVQLNGLEEFLQKQKYLHDQPDATPEPSLEGFEFESTLAKPTVEVETPVFDAKVKESNDILKELRNKEMATAVNLALGNFADALRFLKEDSFVEGDEVIRLDLATIGDPLHADAEKLINMICDYADLD